MSIIAIFQPEGQPLALVSAKPNDVTVELAERATPVGLPFKLIDESEVPTDFTFRSAFEWDGDLNEDNDGYGGGQAPLTENLSKEEGGE